MTSLLEFCEIHNIEMTMQDDVINDCSICQWYHTLSNRKVGFGLIIPIIYISSSGFGSLLLDELMRHYELSKIEGIGRHTSYSTIDETPLMLENHSFVKSNEP